MLLLTITVMPFCEKPGVTSSATFVSMPYCDKCETSFGRVHVCPDDCETPGVLHRQGRAQEGSMVNLMGQQVDAVAGARADQWQRASDAAGGVGCKRLPGGPTSAAE